LPPLGKWLADRSEQRMLQPQATSSNGFFLAVCAFFRQKISAKPPILHFDKKKQAA
jgi:hypothetical protein